MKRVLALLSLSTAAAMAQPAVTAVLDGAAYTINIAAGSIFVVKGASLSAAGDVRATAPSYPATLNNVKLSLTAVTGGAVITERNNSANSVSRPAILRFDPTASGATLTATHEWNLTADLPVVGANLGLEGITWIPDAFLTSKGFVDQSKNHAYNPSEYPNHGTGIFFVGLEANGIVYGYALDHVSGGFTRVATIDTGLGAIMDLQFDRDTNDFWAVCDDTCQGRSVVFRIDSTGKFTVARRFERPAGMPNINNEGFAMAPATLCSRGVKPVFWSDDSSTDGHAIRSGTLTCSPF